MQVNMDDFEKGFDIGLNQAGSMGKRAVRSTIIELCQAPKNPTKNRPNTLGRIAMVPILDKSFSAIHKVEGVESVTVPVLNQDWDETDPNSPQFYYRTYKAIPDYAYLCPLTDSERERIKGYYDLVRDYNNTFSQWGNSIKTLYFMKAFVVKLQSDVSGQLYDDLKEPVIIQHNSSEFPKAYTSMCKTNDEWGHEWRKELFLPDGDVQNVAICSTSKKDVGYTVTFEYKKGVGTGKSIPRANLEQWMDYDINTIGIDCTAVDMNMIQQAVDAINAEWDRQEGKATSQLSGTTEAAPAQAQDTAPAQTAPVSQPAPQATPAASAQPSFDTMNPVGQAAPAQSAPQAAPQQAPQANPGFLEL